MRRRYSTEPVILRNGFYIEIFKKGDNKGMKIRSDNKKDMEDAATMYRGYKEVNLLGEYKNGIPFTEIATA